MQPDVRKGGRIFRGNAWEIATMGWQNKPGFDWEGTLSPGLAMQPPLRGEEKALKSTLGSVLGRKVPRGCAIPKYGGARRVRLYLCQILTIERA